MERLNNSSTTPRDLRLELLEEITDGFSEKHIIGSGGYGKVYKGVLNGKEIAVKKLYNRLVLDDVKFKNELQNLMRAHHQNIVQFVGYCYEIRHRHVEQNGKTVFSQMVDRVLCFEYLQNGSLDKHLYEEHCGLDWCTRYNIIKRICEGLNYLHRESILHLNLKPANVLLDKNMVPKIADFGLSRLFDGTHTQTTKNLIGTPGYMPPEYMGDYRILEKHDVFSLGVIIIQIMTGPEGYSKCSAMPSEKFIELVHQNWKNRIEATSICTSSSNCQQVKRCIEIALKCMEVNRHKRPMIGDIIQELKRTETMIHEMSLPFSQELRNAKEREMVQKEKEGVSAKETMEGEEAVDIEIDCRSAGFWDVKAAEAVKRNAVNLNPNHPTLDVRKHFERGRIWDGKEEIPEQETVNEKANVEKIGPWGGTSGSPYDIEVAPHRLNSVIIGSGEVINSLAFSFSDCNGQQHTAGPWGGNAIPWGGNAPYAGSYHTIQLGPSEFLMKIFGTIGPFYDAPANVVTSLTLVTNAGNYGPFGQGGGSPFHTPMQRNGSIVGFFARTGWYVDAIGVYVNPKQEIMTEEEGRVARIGLWGGNSGSPYDIEVPPRCLKSVIIGSGEVINSLAFSYSDYSGQQHTAGPWGGNGPYGRSYHTIQFGPSEFLVQVSGTIGSFTDAPANVVTSLALITNTSSYGPFGRGGGTPFQTPIQSNGSIVGFFVRAGWYVDAIGVYVSGFDCTV